MAFKAAGLARHQEGEHIGKGRDFEADFTAIMFRLQRYLNSRADPRDKAKVAESQVLSHPLIDALQKGKEAAARATKHKNAAADKGEPPNGGGEVVKNEPLKMQTESLKMQIEAPNAQATAAPGAESS